MSEPCTPRFIWIWRYGGHSCSCRWPCRVQYMVHQLGLLESHDWSKMLLANFDSLKKSKVKLANNSLLQVEVTCDIIIQRSNGEKTMIKDVIYVPGMKWNMLSVTQLIEKGFLVIIQDGALELVDTQNNLVLKSIFSKNRIFQTMISSTKVQCLKSIVDHKHSWMWHLRFGHLNFRSLNQLFTRDMVISIPNMEIPYKLYEVRLVRKQSRNSFVLTMPMRSSYILEVVHSYICGPFEEHTIGGNKYFFFVYRWV